MAVSLTPPVSVLHVDTHTHNTHYAFTLESSEVHLEMAVSPAPPVPVLHV